MAALDVFADEVLWATWRSEDRGSGKPSKVPYASDGRMAKSNDRDTWSTRDAAETAVALHGGGLNIALGYIEGLGLNLGGIDLDACLGEDGAPKSWASEVVDLFDSYTEVTPSGFGLRIFFTYPADANQRRWRHHVQKPNPDGGKAQGIEFYLDKHFMSVTDRVWQGFKALKQIGLDIMDRLQGLMEQFAPALVPTNGAHPPHRTLHQQLDDIGRLYSAIDAMTNHDLSWEEWNTRGMAIYRSTHGSEQGRAAFLKFSQRSTKFDLRAVNERWENWRRSPPDQLADGSIFHWAKEAGWQDPRQRRLHDTGYTYSEDPRPDPTPLGEPKRRPDETLPYSTVNDAHEAALVDPLLMVEGMMGIDNYLTLIYGPSTAGKSFLAIDLAMALATGTPWFSRPTRKAGILYIALEGAVGFTNRLKAYIKHVLDKSVELLDLPFYIINVPINFGPEPTNYEHVSLVINTINKINEESSTPIGAFVCDNLRAIAVGMREGYSEEVAIVFEKTRAIARATGAAPIIIQNTGKEVERGARGSQAQFDLADTVIEVMGDKESGRKFSALKVRDGHPFGPVGFGLTDVELGEVEGIDGTAKKLVSAVVVPADTPIPTAKKQARHARALEVLKTLIADPEIATDLPRGKGFPDRRLKAITVHVWFAELQRRDVLPSAQIGDLSQEEEKAVKKEAQTRFSEVRNRLLSDGKISMLDGHVWLVPKRGFTG
jgi:hypothetical protein